MQAQKFGRIINLTGTQEPVGFNAAIPPNGAVTIWSKQLSDMVAKNGVTVNCISPGIVHSEQIDERVFPTLQQRRDYRFRGDDGASPSIFKFGLYYIRVFLKESWIALVAFSGVVALEAIAVA